MNGSGTPNRSRLTPNPPGAHDASSHNAALKGASLAFQKSTPKKEPIPPPSSRPASRNIDNGALIAATSAASASRDHSRTVSRQTTGGSIQGGNNDIETEQRAASRSSVHSLQLPSQRGLGASSHLAIANKQASPDPRSPSFIAATLAASRSGSPVRHQMTQSKSTPQPVVRQQKHSVSANNSAASSVTSFDLGTDSTSIPSTNALISMFEKREDTDPKKKGNMKSDNKKPFGATTATRTLSPSRAMSPIVKNELSPSRLASTTAWERASPSSSMVDTVQKKPRQPQNVVMEAKARPPAPPPTRTKNKVQTSTPSNVLEPKGKPRALTPPPKPISRVETAILSPQPRRNTSNQIILDDIQAQGSMSEGVTPPTTKPKSKPPAPVHVTTKPSLLEDDSRRISTSSNDTFVSASSAPSPQPSPPRRGRSRPSTPDTVRPARLTSSRTTSTTVTVERPPALPPRQSRPTSTLPLESLTDAIMAGSLASSRITPSKTPPPKPPSRRQTPHMRQTLRQHTSQSDDEEKRREARKLGGKKKHSHHEGARKRWRDEITARERKRYEGVWASNRGLLLVSPDGSRASSTNGQSQAQARTQAAGEDDREQGVANVVVRDLWARSRLPIDELAEVWDLVDRRGKGYLDRTEFVVGMWLVDQRLRGRKIPRKVTESVWGSAKGVRVVEVRSKK
ncbi:uncharacterized protein F4807DRAFT_312264 [Annulohypoxylon truncatum]|uniref:uncharacterized protein n=1 Tax=Annulohypoxylon truncatum TaxID=327061 RepID=UPI0020077A4F|nr:uncharacterized protein F4807DRAFT_312264 [Annulohypoxylon truncatum]KAI1213128.1 hypothetical protein F4807DRAFT_312264 [Annulohypoxylon truncatum]